jgi:hypothetical protein
MDYIKIVYWIVIIATFSLWGYFLFTNEFSNAKKIWMCSKEWRPTSETYCGKLYGLYDPTIETTDQPAVHEKVVQHQEEIEEEIKNIMNS